MKKRNVLALVIFTLAAHAQPLPISPPIYNPVNEHNYILLDTSSWTEAEAAAVLLGGHLVTINDADEQTFIWDSLNSYGGIERALWIGLNDSATMGTFVWSSGEPVIYTNWAAGEPNVCPIYENYGHIFPLSDWRASYWNNILNSGAGGCGGGWHINGIVEIQVSLASFSSSDSTVCEKFCIDFHDQSLGNPVSWQWNFEGGTPASSTDQNPTNICYEDSGVFDVSLITIDGNGNSDTLLLSDFINVYGNPFAPVITQFGNVLICSNASSYQWYLNEVIIPGATYQVYTITESGLYTVVITNENGCQAQTDFDATFVGIGEVTPESISIFPNPAFDQLEISSNGNPISQIMITDFLGETLLRFSFPPPQKEIKLSLADLSNGIYLLQLISDNGIAVKKIVKE